MKKGETNFARAIDYLRLNGLVHNQRELADRIGSTPTTISRNKHAHVGHPDEETIVKFSTVFGDIINVAYLRGESDIMLVEDLSQQEKINMGVNSSRNGSHQQNSSPDASNLIHAALAAKDETIASLHRELGAKDDIIALLRQQIKDLRTQSPQKDLSIGYYPVGVAERENAFNS